MRCCYDKVYLNAMRKVVGRVIDLIVNTYGYPLEDAVSMAIKSDEFAYIEQGKVSFISGKSASDLAYSAVVKQYPGTEQKAITTGRETMEYWFGGAITPFQWKKNIPFAEIFSVLSIKEIASLYGDLRLSDYKVINDRLDTLYNKNLAVKQAEKQLKDKNDVTEAIPRLSAINGNKRFRWNGKSYHVQALSSRDSEPGKKYYVTVNENGVFKPVLDATNNNMLKFKSVPDTQRYIRAWDFMTTTM